MLWPVLFSASQEPVQGLQRSQAGLDHAKYKAVYRTVRNCRVYLFTEVLAQGFKCTL